MDKFGVVRTISKDAITPGQSRGVASMTNSETRTGESGKKGRGNALADPEVDNEKTSRQRIKARISTSTKLPGINMVTSPLVDNGAELEEALNNLKNLSRMTREAEQRELRLRDDMEKLRIQQ